MFGSLPLSNLGIYARGESIGELAQFELCSCTVESVEKRDTAQETHRESESERARQTAERRLPRQLDPVGNLGFGITST